MIKHVLVVLVVLALIPARRVHADATADGERAVVMMEQIATIIDANKDNCDAMGDKLGTYLDKNAAELDKLKAAGRTQTAAQKKAFSEKYGTRLKAVADKMMPGLEKCRTNAKVTAAMKKANAS
ncbi:MAG: hypothetical protein ABI591_13875 [Kofleriaceae bacterium]